MRPNLANLEEENKGGVVSHRRGRLRWFLHNILWDGYTAAQSVFFGEWVWCTHSLLIWAWGLVFFSRFQVLWWFVYHGKIGIGKMWMRVVCLVWMLCLCWGCDDEGKEVGAACVQNTACPSGMFCDLGAPEGYCTMTCSAALPCPVRSFCVRIESVPDGPSAPILLLRCLAQCWAEDDCREGYKCVLPDEEKSKPVASQRRGCFPKISS